MKIFRVKVRPASRQQLFRREEDGSLTVHLKSPPIDGKANQELIQVLANAFRVSKSSVRIKSGASAKNKWVEIDMDE